MLDILARPLLAAAAISLVLSACAVEMREEVASPPHANAAPAAESEDALFTVSAECAADVDITAGVEAAPRFACDPAVLAHLHVEQTPSGVRVREDDDASWPLGARCTVYLTLPSVQAVAATASGDVHVHGQAVELARVQVTSSGDVAIDKVGTGDVRLEVTGSGDVAIAELAARDVRLEVTGSGDVALARVTASSLALSLSGSGSVHAAGTSERVQLELSGSGDVDTRGLRTSDAGVRVSGSGDVALSASRSVAVDVSGSGDVAVSGQPPQRNVSNSGSGSIAFE